MLQGINLQRFVPPHRALRPEGLHHSRGVAAGFRWVIWFAPLWLVLLLPAADFLARRTWLKVLGAALLAVSVLSVSYHTWNPWTHSWLWDYTHEVKETER